MAIETTLLGRTAEKLAIAASAGVKTMLTSALSEMDHSHADVVVEVTGSPQGFALSRTLVGPGGTLVLKSTFGDALQSFDASALVVDEITLVGSRCGPFAPAIALLASGEVDPAPLIHATYPLQDGVAALAKAEEKGVLKVLLAM
jgi:threonine dehydrogenase-like Zn-dependent dehydrogenase